jgi:O-antigen/teichoic acid export membrane protein
LVLVLVLARYFLLEDLGVYGLMVSSVAIAVFALGLEYHYFTIRALIARGVGRQAGIIRDQAVLYALAALIALPPLAVLFWTVWAPVPRSVLVWFFALTVVELAAQEAGIALVALSRPLSANLVLFVRSGVWVYPLIAVAILVPAARTVESVFSAWLCGGLASLAVAAWRLRGIGWGRALGEPVDWVTMRSGLRTAAPFIVTTGASLGLLFLDRFIIEIYQGLGPVGVYTFFAGITTALHTLINTGVSLIRMPRLVKAYQDDDEAGFRRELGGMARVTIAGASLVAVLIALAIVPLLRLVDKAVYEASLGAFFILLPAALIRCVADIPVYTLYARHRDMALLAVNLAAVSVATLLNLLLVPRLGLTGAAMSACAGAATLLVTALLQRSRRGGRGDVPAAGEALLEPLSRSTD